MHFLNNRFVYVNVIAFSVIIIMNLPRPFSFEDFCYALFAGVLLGTVTGIIFHTIFIYLKKFMDGRN